MKRLFIAFLAIAALAAGNIYASGTHSSGSASAKPADTITITDSAGRAITLRRPVGRVVLLDTGPFEIFSAFGILDRVVGNHHSLQGNPLYPELAGLPTVATNSEINFELLAELQPQAVISSVRAHGVITDEESLAGFDIKDIKLNLRNTDLMKEEITLLGTIFDKEEKAREIVAFYNKYENLIAGRIKTIPEDQRVTVFVEYHAGDFKTGAPRSRFYQQIILAGAYNIASNLTEEPQVDPEWVAEMNPDFFIREASGFGYTVTDTAGAKAIFEEIKKREALQTVKAIKNNNVYLISVDIYSRPGYIVGVSYLAKWFYPELFKDLDPEQVHKEYMSLFHPGREFRGLWTYHE
ncbi:MAG: ABC transporter substrate-binding protein [Treponema sp.]|jgi:iron complex transport system substrate-binding protein|nr:ABC transporter substrate-binding protein [Treponema sp.]